mgnify:FL=1
MERLTKTQIAAFRTQLQERFKEFSENNNIEAVRNRTLTVIGLICGEDSQAYKHFRGVGSSLSGGYTPADISTFQSIIQGVIDSLDVLSAQ